MKALQYITCITQTPDSLCVLKASCQAFQGKFIESAFVCRAACPRPTGGALLVTHGCLQLRVFVLQSCLGSTGAFPGRVCSVSSSFCASGNPMTDSILMWLSPCNSTDSKEFTERLEIHTASCTFARNCTPDG